MRTRAVAQKCSPLDQRVVDPNGPVVDEGDVVVRQRPPRRLAEWATNGLVAPPVSFWVGRPERSRQDHGEPEAARASGEPRPLRGRPDEIYVRPNADVPVARYRALEICYRGPRTTGRNRHLIFMRDDRVEGRHVAKLARRHAKPPGPFDAEDSSPRRHAVSSSLCALREARARGLRGGAWR
jgi:hypothetical protein